MVPGTKGQNVEQLDPEQLKFVEILAKLMAENEVFKEEYTTEDFAAVIDWLTKQSAPIKADRVCTKHRAGLLRMT